MMKHVIYLDEEDLNDEGRELVNSTYIDYLNPPQLFKCHFDLRVRQAWDRLNGYSAWAIIYVHDDHEYVIYDWSA